MRNSSMRQKALVTQSHLIETTVADVPRADLHRHPGWSATITRCGLCHGEGWIEHSDYGEKCPACFGDGLLAGPPARQWWRTPLELACIAVVLAAGWAAWTMLP